MPEHDHRATGANARQSGDSRDAAKTKTTAATITNTVASGFDSSPRGNSRMAVRGLRASILASTRRLNPSPRPRADHAHHDPRDLRPRERLFAPGQQRPGQREWQREHRVAESHNERYVASLPTLSGSWKLGVGSRYEPLYRRRFDARHQVFSPRSPSGTRTATRAARLPGSMPK